MTARSTTATNQDTPAGTPTRWPSAAQDPDALALGAVEHLSLEHPVRRRARDEVICRNLAMARRLAGSFAGRGESLDDLIQVANLALIRAADRFSTSHGVSFAGFAGPTILGELRHHFRDTRWHLRVERRLQELYLNVRHCTDELTQELGHHPSLAEIAERVGADVAECERAVAVGAAFQPLSLDRPIDTDDPTNNLTDLIGSADPDLESVPDRYTLAQALAHLSPEDRRLVALRFFGNLSQAEIGEHLGVSQMQVSRLLSAVLAKLAAELLAEE